MDKNFSRRNFIQNSAIALGAVAVCSLTGIISGKSGVTFQALASEGEQASNMTHIDIKLWPGRSEQAKQRLAEAIAEDVVKIIGTDVEAVSVSIEDVSSGDWKEKVYDPEIMGNKKCLYKKPGYSM